MKVIIILMWISIVLLYKRSQIQTLIKIWVLVSCETSIIHNYCLLLLPDGLYIPLPIPQCELQKRRKGEFEEKVRISHKK